jgi:hypothetical protein
MSTEHQVEATYSQSIWKFPRDIPVSVSLAEMRWLSSGSGFRTIYRAWMVNTFAQREEVVPTQRIFLSFKRIHIWVNILEVLILSSMVIFISAYYSLCRAESETTLLDIHSPHAKNKDIGESLFFVKTTSHCQTKNFVSATVVMINHFTGIIIDAYATHSRIKRVVHWKQKSKNKGIRDKEVIWVRKFIQAEQLATIEFYFIIFFQRKYPHAPFCS